MFLLSITLIVVISNLLLGLIAFIKNPKSATSRLFLLLTIILSFWAITNYFSLIVGDPEEILFWIRSVMVVTGAMFPVIYLLTKAFPRTEAGTSKLRMGAIFIFVLFIQTIAMTGLVFQKVEVKGIEVTPVPGPGMPIFAFDVIGFLLLTLYTLYKKNKKFVGLEKIQLRYLILGIALTFILATLTNFVLVNLLKITSLVSLGPIFTLIMVGSISYAIVKHRFLDINLLVARTVSYTLLVAFLGFLYAFMFAIASSLLVSSTMSTKTIIVSTFLALFMAFTFQSVRKFLERTTDKIFYKNRYETNTLLYDLTLIMASTINLKDLTHQILKELLRQMRIINGAFILIDDDHIYEVVHEGNSETPSIEEKSIISLLSHPKTLIFDEIQEGDIKAVMRSHGLSVVTPLTTEGKYLGILALGDKLSGDIYVEEDIKVIEILAPEAAVAIQNAKAYEEISRFNITLQKEVDQATKDLQSANTKLKQLDQLKDDFVSVASHELRTPMTAIKSYLWMALKKPDAPLSEKMNKYLDRAYISTERLINLVNDMLNVSRIESGRVEIRPLAFNIEKLVDDVLVEVNAKASEKSVALHVLKGQIPQVFADADKVHQVLLNLIGNSLKFTPEGGSIIISFFSDGKTVETSVKDSGVGMSKDDLSRLFQKFGRLDNSYVAAATSGGTGLGLFISKSLVEMMGGRIQANSEGINKGSTFTFSLPAATPDVLAKAEQYTKKVEGSEAKVLEPVAI